MKYKKFLEGLAVNFMGFLMLYFGLAFYIIGRNIYGKDATLIFAGGMLSVFAVNGLAQYYFNLFNHRKKGVKK